MVTTFQSEAKGIPPGCGFRPTTLTHRAAKCRIDQEWASLPWDKIECPPRKKNQKIWAKNSGPLDDSENYSRFFQLCPKPHIKEKKASGIIATQGD